MNAFSGIWPQYQRGYKKTYGDKTAQGQIPFVGQPVTGDPVDFSTVEPDQPTWISGGGGGGSTGTSGGLPANVYVPPTPTQASGTYPVVANDPRAVGNPPVRRATLVARPGDIVGRDTPPNQVYQPPSGQVAGPDTPPGEVYTPPAVRPPLTVAQGGYQGWAIPMKAWSEAMARPDITATQAPSVAQGGYQSWNIPQETWSKALGVPESYPAGGGGGGGGAPAQHRAAAPAGAAAPTVMRAYPPGVTPRAELVAYPPGYFQNAPQGNLIQRFLQSLGHFFTGTLGQHQAPQQPQGFYDPRGYFYPTGTAQTGAPLTGQAAYDKTLAFLRSLTPAQQHAFLSTGRIPYQDGGLVSELPGAVTGTVAPMYYGSPPPNYPRVMQLGPVPVQPRPTPSPAGPSRHPPFVGQPIGADGQYSYPVPESEPSAFGRTGPGQSVSQLASSGTPEHMYNLGSPSSQLTNIGGYTGGVAGGFSPLSSAAGSLLASKTRGAGEGGGGGPGLLGQTGIFGGGAGGLSAGQMGGAASSAISAFGDLFAKTHAPVSVDPAAWAGAPPPPATFTFPTLAPNYPQPGGF
jgi:hypothetical protein